MGGWFQTTVVLGNGVLWFAMGLVSAMADSVGLVRDKHCGEVCM